MAAIPVRQPCGQVPYGSRKGKMLPCRRPELEQVLYSELLFLVEKPIYSRYSQQTNLSFRPCYACFALRSEKLLPKQSNQVCCRSHRFRAACRLCQSSHQSSLTQMWFPLPCPKSVSRWRFMSSTRRSTFLAHRSPCYPCAVA